MRLDLNRYAPFNVSLLIRRVLTLSSCIQVFYIAFLVFFSCRTQIISYTSHVFSYKLFFYTNGNLFASRIVAESRNCRLPFRYVLGSCFFIKSIRHTDATAGAMFRADSCYCGIRCQSLCPAPPSGVLAFPTHESQGRDHHSIAAVAPVYCSHHPAPHSCPGTVTLCAHTDRAAL